MITFKDRVYSFEEIEEKVLAGEIDNDKDFIIEALRSCFYTEDGMTVVDENGVTIMTNEAHKNIMGIDGREIVGKKVSDLVKEGVFQESATENVMRTKHQENIIQHIRTGKVTLTTATPVFDEDGNLCRIINNIRDVPGLNELYEENRKHEALIENYRSRIQKQNSLERKGLAGKQHSHEECGAVCRAGGHERQHSTDNR